MREPEFGLQQVGVVAHEYFAHIVVVQQERAECFGKDIARADAVPDFAAELVFFIARRRHFAEVAIGDVFNFVVIVKNDLAQTGDAKVFPQHVARKDVGCHHVFDGVAIFDHGMLDLLACARIVQPHVEGFLQIHVQRDHALFDVEVLDDHFLHAVSVAIRKFDLARGVLLQLRQQFRLEAIERKRHFAVFHGIGHAPYPVVLAHQLVFFADLFTRGFFLRRVKVFDDLEHVRQRRQIKYQHDHAFDAGRNAQFVGAVTQVEQKIAKKQGFALLAQAQCVVKLGTWLARHQTAQKMHIGGRDLHIHQEIRPRKAEERQQIVFALQNGVDIEFALIIK